MDDETRQAFADLMRLTNEQHAHTIERITGLEARYDRHDTKLDNIRNDITVSMVAVNHATRATDNTHDELRSLRDVVGIMRTQLRRLSARLDTIERGKP